MLLSSVCAGLRARCYPFSFHGHFDHLHLPSFPTRRSSDLQAPPSLHRVLAARVPRLRRYYGVLRIPNALPDALQIGRAHVSTPFTDQRRTPPSRCQLKTRTLRFWPLPPASSS